MTLSLTKQPPWRSLKGGDAACAYKGAHLEKVLHNKRTEVWVNTDDVKRQPPGECSLS